MIKLENSLYQQLKKIKDNFESDISWKEKLLTKEMNFLTSEMDVKKANQKMERALQTLDEIDIGSFIFN